TWAVIVSRPQPPPASGLFYSCFSIGEETNRLEPALSMVAASPRMVRGEESLLVVVDAMGFS
ncbi:MAG: hypothetical protein CMH50_11450, partial [Myxococcales bacterium]|nr:hypothetical protein [Myxococcales bacterium]